MVAFAEALKKEDYAGGIAVVEAASRGFRNANPDDLISQVGVWFSILRQFKSLEAFHMLHAPRVGDENHKHESALNSLLRAGENIESRVETEKTDLGELNLTLRDVKANVQYLRDLQRQWYSGGMSDAEFKKLKHLIIDEPRHGNV